MVENKFYSKDRKMHNVKISTLHFNNSKDMKDGEVLLDEYGNLMVMCNGELVNVKEDKTSRKYI